MQKIICCVPFTESHKFDIELVSKIISDLKKGKSMDVDRLTALKLRFRVQKNKNSASLRVFPFRVMGVSSYI